jgi:hypothetical protein
VGVDVDVGVLVPSLVLVAPRVAVGDGVPVWVGVALGPLVALGVAVRLDVGIPVEEIMVGFALPVMPDRPHASSVASSATAPAPVKKRRRLNSRRVFFEPGYRFFLVIGSIIEAGKRNVKRAKQAPSRRFPYAGWRREVAGHPG